MILKSKHKKAWLTFGIVLDLSLLFYFKYIVFILNSLSTFFTIPIQIDSILLPLGISFFTFTQIAFLVDAYKSDVHDIKPSSYSLFVTVFPHLISGPIIHHKNMIQQFNSPDMYRINLTNISQGIILFCIGMIKKVLIADTLSPVVVKLFDTAVGAPGLFDAWGVALAYTLQLYFDFSGYTDMAVGLGLLFNINLPLNFNSPYKADSMIEFWRRWHMTFSDFLRDYVYIPLGGNRFGEFNRFKNLFLTMLIGGIWHGAGWTFLLWGALHGMYLMINHWSRKRFILPTFIGWPATFLAIMVGWVLFRAPDFHKAWDIFSGMIGLNAFSMQHLTLKDWGFMFVLLAVVMLMPNSNEIRHRFQPSKRLALTMAIALAICVMNLSKISEFLYYQF
jgi:alginate O-acetyltransferase complex protein AlgI